MSGGAIHPGAFSFVAEPDGDCSECGIALGVRCGLVSALDEQPLSRPGWRRRGAEGLELLCHDCAAEASPTELPLGDASPVGWTAADIVSDVILRLRAMAGEMPHASELRAVAEILEMAVPLLPNGAAPGLKSFPPERDTGTLVWRSHKTGAEVTLRAALRLVTPERAELVMCPEDGAATGVLTLGEGTLRDIARLGWGDLVRERVQERSLDQLGALLEDVVARYYPIDKFDPTGEKLQIREVLVRAINLCALADRELSELFVWLD